MRGILYYMTLGLFFYPGKEEKPKIYYRLFVSCQICKTFRYLDARNSPFRVATIYRYHFVFNFFLFFSFSRFFFFFLLPSTFRDSGGMFALLNKLTNFTVKTITKSVYSLQRSERIIYFGTITVLVFSSDNNSTRRMYKLNSKRCLVLEIKLFRPEIKKSLTYHPCTIT